MIAFPKRRDLVVQVQTILGLTADGIDGMQTWHALGTLFLPAGHPAMRGIEPRASPQKFNGRAGLVAAIQQATKTDVDGRDGPQTWSAVVERLASLPARNPILVTPTDSYPEAVRGRSPNRNAGVNTCEGIVFHHAAGYFEGTISWCLQAGTQAGYHCLINTDGTRAILALDTDRCHHAGQSSWKGRASCNHFMLGLSFIGNTNTGAMRPSKDLTADELASAREWVRVKMNAHKIAKENITHHRVVSPGRKDDLSPAAWDQVRKALDL